MTTWREALTSTGAESQTRVQAQIPTAVRSLEISALPGGEVQRAAIFILCEFAAKRAMPLYSASAICSR
jgi:hypothetical protein